MTTLDQTVQPFTSRELTTLTEALDAWIDKDAAGSFMTGVAGALMIERGDVAARQRWDAEEKERREQEKTARALRAEEATLLKAKLIQLRRSMQSAAEFAVSQP